MLARVDATARSVYTGETGERRRTGLTSPAEVPVPTVAKIEVFTLTIPRDTPYLGPLVGTQTDSSGKGLFVPARATEPSTASTTTPCS